MKNRESAPRNVQARALEEKVIQLKIAGHSFQTIASMLGYQTRSAAYKAWKRAHARRMAELGQAVDEDRLLELERLERLQASFWPLALKGNVQAGRLIVQISKRRSALLGLDAPVKVVGPNGGPIQHEHKHTAADLPDLEGMSDDELSRLYAEAVGPASGTRH